MESEKEESAKKKRKEPAEERDERSSVMEAGTHATLPVKNAGAVKGNWNGAAFLPGLTKKRGAQAEALARKK